MKSVRFHDSKLKLVKALLFRSFYETEAPTAGFVQRLFVEGRIYSRNSCTHFTPGVPILPPQDPTGFLFCFYVNWINIEKTRNKIIIWKHSLSGDDDIKSKFVSLVILPIKW